MGFLNWLGEAVGIAGAPFTGGASLALTGLNLGSDIFSTIQGNNAIGRALGQQLGGIERATGDITKAQTGAEDILKSSQQTALETGYAGTGSVLSETAPYTQTGGNAAYALNNYQSPNIPLKPEGFSFDPSQVQFDPGTKAIMDLAADTLSRSAAGRGALGAGGTKKDIAQYLTTLGGSLYGQAYNRQFQTALTRYQTGNEQNVQQFQAGQTNAANQFNRLYSLSGQGLSASGQNVNALTQFYQRMMGVDENTAAQIAQSRLATGGNLANLGLAGGQARAAATLGKTNNLVTGVNNAAYDLSTFLSQNQNQRRRPGQPPNTTSDIDTGIFS